MHTRHAAVPLSLALVLATSTAIVPAARAQDALPLGDGRISAGPKQGHLFSCQQQFSANAPGAQRDGSWIRKDEWAPWAKVAVDGAISWPNAKIEISVEGDQRVVRANNLPTHKTGVFPVARTDDAYQFDRNPNRIAEQDILLSLPAVPQPASNPSCVPMGMIGFSLTGAAIFNAVDARGDDAPAHEIQDSCNGHPERTGQYHYHNLSPCMVDNRSETNGHSDLLGYALDGFGIYGLYGADGEIVHNADLDACHGHVHAVTWDGQDRSIYHYHYTEEYPYAVGCLRGVVKTGLASPSTAMQPPRLAHRNAPTGPRGGEVILRQAANILGVSERLLRDAVGAPPPDFRRAARKLGISETKLRAAFDPVRR